MRRLFTASIVLLVTGLVVAPLAVYLFGRLFAGPYDADAGFLAFLGSIYVDLGAGAPWAWLLALSPALLYLTIRLAALIWRALGSSAPDAAEDAG